MRNAFLLASFVISLSLHLIFYLSFLTMTEQRRSIRRPPTRLIAVVSKPKLQPKPKTQPPKPVVKKKKPAPLKPIEKKPEKKSPPKIVKKKIPPKPMPPKPKPTPPVEKPPQPAPEKTPPPEFADIIPHMRTPANNPPSATPPKAVFGVSPDSVRPGNRSGFSVRVGNTLLKKQEEAFTPQDEVKTLTTDPAWETGPVVPAYELSTMALFKKKVHAKYPDLLMDEEIEGSVHLRVVVNRFGNVVDIKVKSTDHPPDDRCCNGSHKAVCLYTRNSRRCPGDLHHR